MKVSELTYNKTLSVKGATVEEKIQNLLLVYLNKDVSESMYTRLLSAHFKEVHKELNSHKELIQKMTEKIISFEESSEAFISWVQQGGHRK